MTKHQWMAAMYGLDRQDDSNRCRVGATLFDHAPNLISVQTMMALLGLTEAQVRSELSRVTRRLKKYDIPCELIWKGKESVQLVRF